MAKPDQLGKCELIFRYVIRIGGRAGQGIAVVQPLHEIAVAAARGAEWRMLFDARFAAYRAFLRRFAHMLIACAKLLFSARDESACQRIIRPVRRLSSASHSGVTADFTAG